MSAALNGSALPASSDLITAPTLLTPSAINTVDLAPVNVTANVPADDSFFGGIGSQLAQNYRASRQVIDNVLQGANHLIDHADATIDTARGALRDWSSQHGGVIGGAIGKYVSDQIGAAQGFGLAAAKAVTGTASLAVSVSDVTNPASWVLDTERNIDHVMSTYRTLDTIDSVTSLGRWAADPQQSLHNATALWDGVTAEYRKDLAAGDASKAVGRLSFEVVSAGAPLLAAKVGKAGTIARAADEAAAAAAAADAARVGEEAAAAAARGGDVSAAGVGRGSATKNTVERTVAGETTSTAIGKSVHAQLAAARRASGDFDLVNQAIVDSAGNPVEVVRRVDLSTGKPVLQSGSQVSKPDAIQFKNEVIIDDKPLGRFAST
ncbi:hypothetical protein [Luteibacter sp. 3190]|uniref:hypothetical protein n=1 Tax=Luteibacter sp. 3190 TaxID=2817736 RepID=UPI002861A1B8|nr:hypothetical protein [Luteibacter sp. 3190]MDR6937890.1 hypothetical protein [Luteibacter sp. 3190]